MRLGGRDLPWRILCSVAVFAAMEASLACGGAGDAVESRRAGAGSSQDRERAEEDDGSDRATTEGGDATPANDARRAAGSETEPTPERALPSDATTEPVALTAEPAAPAADAVAPTPITYAGTAIATPQILVMIGNLEEDVRSLARLRELLTRLRTESALSRVATQPPRACSSGLRDELNSLVREGNTTISSNAHTYRDLLDDLCGRYERWAEPNEVTRTRLLRYREHIDRIERWMHEILTCIHPGPYDARCENSYGPETGDGANEARRVQQVLDDLRRLLEGVPNDRRFPCGDPMFERIERMRWTLTVASAQVPGLATQARSLCSSLGVEPADLQALVTQITDQIARDEAQSNQLATSRRMTLRQLRATYGLPND